MSDPLQKPIARSGEQQFAAIIRNRSGYDSGEIDMGVRVYEIEKLHDHDQKQIVQTAFSLLVSVLDHVRPEARNVEEFWLERVKKRITAQPTEQCGCCHDCASGIMFCKNCKPAGKDSE